MRPPHSKPTHSKIPWRDAWLLVAIASVCACATGDATRPKPIATHDESGFTITEKVSVSSEVRANFQSAVDMLEQGDNERGIDLLVAATRAAPNVTTLHIDLGIAYARAGNFEKAEESLEQALRLNPDHPVAHNELGIVYRKTGRFREARKSYEEALAEHPDFHFARRNLAILCDVYLGDLGCALDNYELYTKAVPEDEAAAVWIADLRNRVER